MKTTVRDTQQSVSVAVRGYNGPGWELQCIGPKQWVARTRGDYH